MDWKIVAMLLAAGSIMYLPALGAAGILTSDAYYSAAAREMLNRHDFITPYLNFKPFYEKPILIYWLIIASYKAFGVSTLAARLPSALCAIAAVVALFVLTRQFAGRRVACFAAMTLACSPLFAVVGHLALTDMPLTLFTLLANLFYLLVLIKQKRQFAIAGHVSLALAILCKGPMAIFFICSCVLGFLAVTSASQSIFWTRLSSLKPFLGLGILIAVAGPWFVVEHFATNSGFTQYFFIQQTFGRISGRLPSHVYPFWFYFPYFLGGFFPWSLILLQSPLLLRLRKRRLLRSPRHEILIASACWLVGSLLMLLSAGSKLPTYLLPLAPPLAILVGSQLDTIIRLNRKRLIIWTAPLLVLSLLVALPFTKQFLLHSENLISVVIAAACLLLAGFLIYTACLLRARTLQATNLLFCCCAAACALLVPLGLVEEYRRGPEGLHTLLSDAQKLHHANIAVLPQDIPSASFYVDKPIFELQVPQDCNAFLKTTSAPHFIIVESKYLPAFQRAFGNLSENVAQNERWNLLFLKENRIK